MTICLPIYETRIGPTYKLDDIPDVPSCTCPTCEGMCRRPCWPTPDEVNDLIDAGFANRLMEDQWVSNPDIYLICPALKGYERQNAPFMPRSELGCTFWKDRRCELHSLDLKPSEGRLATCSDDIYDDSNNILHRSVAATWDTPLGHQVIDRWKSVISD